MVTMFSVLCLMGVMIVLDVIAAIVLHFRIRRIEKIIDAKWQDRFDVACLQKQAEEYVEHYNRLDERIDHLMEILENRMDDDEKEGAE